MNIFKKWYRCKCSDGIHSIMKIPSPSYISVPDSEFAKETYVETLRNWNRERLISPKSDNSRMEIFLLGKKIDKDLQLLIAKDNYYTYPYIKEPFSETTAYVLNFVTGNNYKATDITPKIEKALKKLILSLHESYITSNLPIPKDTRNILNNLNVFFDDYEIRHNEYMSNITRHYSSFRKETGIYLNHEEFIKQMRKYILANYAISEKGGINYHNSPQAVEMYSDAVFRKKSMLYIETMQQLDKKQHLEKVLKSRGLSVNDIPEKNIALIMRGIPVELPDKTYLVQVKTPSGYEFKIKETTKAGNSNEMSL